MAPPEKTKVTLVGKLRYTEADSLQYSYEAEWYEALSSSRLFGEKFVAIFPNDPRSTVSSWTGTEPSYQLAAKAFIEHQNQEPQQLYPPPNCFPLGGGPTTWAYKDFVVDVKSNEPNEVRNEQREAVLVKHFILRRERDYERVRREVDALENLERIDRTSREPIPESVRLFVWQRDGGKCVKCGSRERLEFDHIIPLAEGGSSTERNIQLLCEPCNRSKGSTI